MDLDEYASLKRQVERYLSDKQKSQGALDHMMERLEQEFRITTVEEAETLLEQINAEITELEEQKSERIEQLAEQLRRWSPPTS